MRTAGVLNTGWSKFQGVQFVRSFSARQWPNSAVANASYGLQCPFALRGGGGSVAESQVRTTGDVKPIAWPPEARAFRGCVAMP